jgi:hypothetical protein
MQSMLYLARFSEIDIVTGSLLEDLANKDTGICYLCASLLLEFSYSQFNLAHSTEMAVQTKKLK